MITWQNKIEQRLSVEISHLTSLSGGDFADAYQASLSNGKTVFVKTHHEPITDFFSTESTGLTWLRASNTVNVPKVLFVDDHPPVLALEWISSGSSDAEQERRFGRELAKLHAVSSEQFGRPDQRPTGSQGLPNELYDHWMEHYAQNRLLPLAKLAAERNALPQKFVRQIESIAQRLDQLSVPDEPPALVHGDLWAGNRLIDHRGSSWLIDPAAHFGHREFDLAMMQLFGGFSQHCFAGYTEVSPLADDSQERIALHQIAPLVVHAIKFGGHYQQAAGTALQRYC